MEILTRLMMVFLAASVAFGLGEPTTRAEEAMSATQKVQPDPMRNICAYWWDSYYKKGSVDIEVSTRGKYNETVVFVCPDCSLEEHFVKPFLNSEYQGKTGMDRIRECGFTQAAFRGARGLQEIVVQVP